MPKRRGAGLALRGPWRWARPAARRKPAENRLVRWVFLRALGGIYFVAFASLHRQVLGLYGSRGISPVANRLARVRDLVGPNPYRLVPTVFWLDASDAALVRAARSGMALSVLLMLGVRPRAVLALLWTLYLSFVSVGGDFLPFQWDALLLEAGANAILIAPGGARPKIGRENVPWPAVLLMRWLVFRLHYESGIAKLRSGDPTWRDRTACSYHYETQPLPTRLGWYAHHLSPKVQRLSTELALGAECILPFAAFGPRAVRRAGFLLLAGLQFAIAATGNYGFFNVLTMTLGVWLLDDEMLWKVLGIRAPRRARPMAAFGRIAVGSAACVLIGLSAIAHQLRFGPRPPPRIFARAIDWALPLQSINVYGLFSVMTVRRPEIAIEASMDGVSWREYGFRYKVGDIRRPPRWVAPHQPRLDWQMWFAALEPPPPWFVSLLVRLLEGSPDVLALLEHRPFGDRRPRLVRAILYQYRMTDSRTRRRTGAWWRRERVGVYVPPIALPAQDREGAPGATSEV